MRLFAASPGSLPKPENADQPLRQVIEQQLTCDLDVLSDGQIGWADPVSHLPAQMTGMELAEQGPYLDTPLQVRRPRIRGPFAWAVPVARPEFARAQALSARPVKTVLTGALTMAQHAIVLDPYYRRDHVRLVMDLNEALACEVRELAAEGAAVIQLDEPAILREHEPGAWRLMKSCVRRLNAAKGGARLLVNVGWGDPIPVLEELFSVPADILAIDLTRNARLGAILAHAELRKPVQLGIVDGWSESQEDPRALAGALEEFVATSTAPECYLSSSAGFRALSPEAAVGKLRALAQTRDLLREFAAAR